ncbi:MAG: AAA family ATPase [Actinobacteria bacterium]|nr:AAA family ATPase [Actinomycetota bacterium]
MRLKRVVAEHFGRLKGAQLGDLDKGLNVVLGPNEVGKTSFANLVRQLFYGFAGKRGGEAAYVVDDGKRQGLLVLTDGSGEWSVKRVDGAHGGPVSVTALSGADQPDILNNVTSGISREAFRVVLGFGLSELAEIEKGSASNDGVLSRLFAAQAGLAVNPADVKADLEKEAGELWAPSKSKPILNQLKAQIKAIKSEITQLEAKASGYAADQERYRNLSDELEEARTAREQAQRAAKALAVYEQELRTLEGTREEMRKQIASAGPDLERANQALGSIKVDDDLFAATPAIEAVLSDLSGFEQQMSAIANHDSSIIELEARTKTILGDVGITATQAQDADITPDSIAGIEKWRAQLVKKEHASDEATRKAQDLAARCEESEQVTEATAQPASSGYRSPGIIMAATGLLLVASGAALGEIVSLVLGLAVLGAGAFFLWRSRGAGPSKQPESAPAEIAVQMKSAKRDAELRRAEFESDLQGWSQWLTSKSLDCAGENPTAVATTVAAIKEWRSVVADLDKVRALRSKNEAWCEDYLERLNKAVEGLRGLPSASSLVDVASAAASIKHMKDQNTAAMHQRETVRRTIERLADDLAKWQNELEATRSKIEEVLEKVGLSPGADVAQLSALSQEADLEAKVLGEKYDDVLRNHTELKQKLGEEERDSSMAAARLEMTGLEELVQQKLEEYAVLAIAARLVERTQKEHEKNRQPAVIQRAGQIFADITEGRYTGVVVPGDGRFIVLNGNSDAIPSSELSTGTVQQLYLALRFALIETLDAVGVGLPVIMDDVLVNADPTRREGLARAIVELSGHRQVIFFTCHPETAELLSGVADPKNGMPGVKRISLSGPAA